MGIVHTGKTVRDIAVTDRNRPARHTYLFIDNAVVYIGVARDCIEPAAAVACPVAAEGAVVKRRFAAIVEDAPATVVLGPIAAEQAVHKNRIGRTIIYPPAAVKRPVADEHAVDHQRAAVDIDHPAALLPDVIHKATINHDQSGRVNEYSTSADKL